MSKYNFDEWGGKDQIPEPPRFDLVAVVALVLVAGGIALTIQLL